MLNFIKLYSGHLKSSKKVLIIASIGLICALTLVSSTNYYFDNSKVELVNNYFSNYSGPGRSDVQFSVSLVNLNSYNKSFSTIVSDVNYTQKEFHVNYFKSIVIQPELSGLELTVNSSSTSGYNSTIQVVQLTNSFIQELTKINKANPLITR